VPFGMHAWSDVICKVLDALPTLVTVSNRGHNFGRLLRHCIILMGSCLYYSCYGLLSALLLIGPWLKVVHYMVNGVPFGTMLSFNLNTIYKNVGLHT
jgi:hypothetical protein